MDTISGGRVPADPPHPPDIAFDNGLVVSGDKLRYTLPGFYLEKGLELDIERNGNQLLGSLGGWLEWPGNLLPSVLTGTADSTTGRLTGTSQGFSVHSGGLGSEIDCPDASSPSR
jgi:hypothetical protein